MEGFSIGRLPDSVRSLLRDLPDKNSMKLGHEASTAEMRSFWSSLDIDQLSYIAKMFKRVMDDEEPAVKAASYFGSAEATLHMVHGGCLCGDRHKDPDDLLRELMMRGEEYDAESSALELYGLRRMQTHAYGDESQTVYVCLECGHAFESLERRRAAGDPGDCPGCKNNGE